MEEFTCQEDGKLTLKKMAFGSDLYISTLFKSDI